MPDARWPSFMVWCALHRFLVAVIEILQFSNFLGFSRDFANLLERGRFYGAVAVSWESLLQAIVLLLRRNTPIAVIFPAIGTPTQGGGALATSGRGVSAQHWVNTEVFLRGGSLTWADLR